MAIIKQYRKDIGVTYVYESKSYRDREKQQPRAKRKLLGKIDPVTGELVPTGSRGPKPKAEKTEKTVPEASDGKGSQKAASRENPSASSADTQLRKENEQLRRENTELREENERLQSRVDHLRGFLGGIASSCAEEARQ